MELKIKILQERKIFQNVGGKRSG